MNRLAIFALGTALAAGAAFSIAAETPEESAAKAAFANRIAQIIQPGAWTMTFSQTTEPQAAGAEPQVQTTDVCITPEIMAEFSMIYVDPFSGEDQGIECTAAEGDSADEALVLVGQCTRPVGGGYVATSRTSITPERVSFNSRTVMSKPLADKTMNDQIEMVRTGGC